MRIYTKENNLAELNYRTCFLNQISLIGLLI